MAKLDGMLGFLGSRRVRLSGISSNWLCFLFQSSLAATGQPFSFLQKDTFLIPGGTSEAELRSRAEIETAATWVYYGLRSELRNLCCWLRKLQEEDCSFIHICIDWLNREEREVLKWYSLCRMYGWLPDGFLNCLKVFSFWPGFREIRRVSLRALIHARSQRPRFLFSLARRWTLPLTA